MSLKLSDNNVGKSPETVLRLGPAVHRNKNVQTLLFSLQLVHILYCLETLIVNGAYNKYRISTNKLSVIVNKASREREQRRRQIKVIRGVGVKRVKVHDSFICTILSYGQGHSRTERR